MFAVEVGSQVQVSTVDRLDGLHYWLDYAVNGVFAWCPKEASKQNWIQVSIDQPRYWTDVIIQGRGDKNNWTKSFRVEYSINGKYWYNVDEGNIFPANSDRNTKKRVTFGKPVYARALRIYPNSWHNHPCLRFDAVYINCQP